MALIIRPIRREDKVAWLRLFKEYICFYKSELSDEQFDLTWDRIQSDFNIYALVAVIITETEEEEVVGIAHYIFRPSTWAVEDYCYLEDLYVDPKVRGGGIGRALIKELESIATSKGAKRLYWTTAPDNATARNLYDKVAIADRVQYKIFLNKTV
jgi:GNAT superfamily N-acetyltransferase